MSIIQGARPRMLLGSERERWQDSVDLSLEKEQARLVLIGGKSSQFSLQLKADIQGDREIGHGAKQAAKISTANEY